MNQASISCIVPTLNSAPTLEFTLLSLLSQRDIPIEVIVADSGSSDGTLEICRRWSVKIIYAEPGNMYRAINAGLRQSKSRWFAYLNSDDLVYTDTYSRLISLGESLKADIVYGNCDYIDWQGRFVYSFSAAKPDELLSLFRLSTMGFAQQTAIFRREVYEKQSGFDESFRFRADADFYIRALKLGLKFARLEGPSVACFRLHGNQFSNQYSEVDSMEASKLFDSGDMSAHPGDWAKMVLWRLRNLPHYAIRILRESMLAKRLRFPRAIETYTHR